ncbi:unnamed protein product [Didymodactylos carnosus]|uniref:Globin-sensor domain-containing protein n=1 Tax=Didymodactylos carnosus TaxID=1234261 RepID=A0A814I2M3_9BILA|nr:unnamed protein product [Didymodactylos carnosus]CAF1384882.1 unnamed protein product [Didymodactylos carnosus]CAF3789542.1 unnamed protein product [Didymodactylos carnosus]CAF4193020.1 unnamed protein product [Didymodactylos carnosus]
MEHIDDDQLATNLRYRFDYVAKFIRWSNDDIAVLNSLEPIVSPLLPVVVDAVYKKLFQFDVTKRFFFKRNEGFEGNLPSSLNDLTLNSEQIQFRKDMLSRYLTRVITTKVWDDSFLQYLSRVGKIHTNNGGSKSINVPYIHVNALLGYVEHILIDAVWGVENVDNKTKKAAILSINKFFWIQNDLFTMHYIGSSSVSNAPKDDTAIPSNTSSFAFNHHLLMTFALVAAIAVVIGYYIGGQK